jgi:hypothetical protein
MWDLLSERRFESVYEEGSRRSESGSHIPAYSAHTLSWRLPCPKVNRLLGQGRADPA